VDIGSIWTTMGDTIGVDGNVVSRNTSGAFSSSIISNAILHSFNTIGSVVLFSHFATLFIGVHWEISIITFGTDSGIIIN